jgi:hypothetical protein
MQLKIAQQTWLEQATVGRVVHFKSGRLMKERISGERAHEPR